MTTRMCDLTIGGRSYRLATVDEQENRLRALAARVDAQLKELKEADPNIDRDRQLILACLQLASDLADAHAKLDGQAVAVTHFHRDVAQRLEQLLPRT